MLAAAHAWQASKIAASTAEQNHGLNPGCRVEIVGTGSTQAPGRQETRAAPNLVVAHFGVGFIE